ncbi:Zinc finger C2H2-type,Zinc finger, RING/FYVE/PHD-type [Cinara cedri]|uniref:Zinc finger C2H2-type,Zinc finger, RING/FYVE/PHD-type n=1 Tax=Cinara cedri TaxID=506608 RepID=A0A5E4MB78_9HEMI|nr:Zinc finger C2H2-type,Zinc finger, RING/FYVE/PHD-type [Cinara cedri]
MLISKPINSQNQQLPAKTTCTTVSATTAHETVPAETPRATTLRPAIPRATYSRATVPGATTRAAVSATTPCATASTVPQLATLLATPLTTIPAVTPFATVPVTAPSAASTVIPSVNAPQTSPVIVPVPTINPGSVISASLPSYHPLVLKEARKEEAKDIERKIVQSLKKKKCFRCKVCKNLITGPDAEHMYEEHVKKYRTTTLFWLEKLNEAVKSDPSVCPGRCGRKFGGQNRKANLKYHLIKHCGKIFNCPIYFMLKRTDMWACKDNPVYCPKNCGRCYKGMWRKYNLQKHLKYECGVAPQFKCLACSKNENNILLRLVDQAITCDPAYCPNKCGRFYKGQHRKINLRRHVFECGVLPRFPCYAYYSGNLIGVPESNPVMCPNNCGRCYSGKNRKNNLKKHLKLECGVAPKFSCRICWRRFTRNEGLKRHLIMSLQLEKERKYRCPILYAHRLFITHFKKIRQAETNFNWGDTEKELYILATRIQGLISDSPSGRLLQLGCIVQCSCLSGSLQTLSDPVMCPNNCGRYYSGKRRKDTLRQHLKLECGVDPMFSCLLGSLQTLPNPVMCPNNCGRYYSGPWRKSSLKKHLKLECDQSEYPKELPDPLMCPNDCGRYYRLSGTIQTLPDPIMCPNNCGRYYSGRRRKNTLNQHLKLECGVEPRFSCAICLRKFTRNDFLNLLEEISESDPVTCPNCKRQYSGRGRKYNLKKHLTLECGVAPMFSCLSGNFPTLPDLVVCPNGCGRHYVGSFSKYNLKKHLTFECGVEPKFSCAICLRRFTRKEGLKRHLTMVHRMVNHCAYTLFRSSDDKS